MGEVVPFKASPPFLFRTKKGERLIIQRRDLEILTYIAERRFAPEPVLIERFWSEDRWRNRTRRLHQYCRAGFIARVDGPRESVLGYRLEPEGRRLLHSNGIQPGEPLNGRSPYTTTYDHDCLVERFRDILERSPLVSDFVTEADLRRDAGVTSARLGALSSLKVPDAMFSLRTTKGTRRIALEVELTRKSKKRYRELVRRLATQDDIDSTFFVTSCDTIARLLVDAIGEARTSDPLVRSNERRRGFYFCSVENLERHGLVARFAGDGRNFSLASLAEEVAQVAAS